jgi:hypothetical protein
MEGGACAIRKTCITGVSRPYRPPGSSKNFRDALKRSKRFRPVVDSVPGTREDEEASQPTMRLIRPCPGKVLVAKLCLDTTAKESLRLLSITRREAKSMCCLQNENNVVPSKYHMRQKPISILSQRDTGHLRGVEEIATTSRLSGHCIAPQYLATGKAYRTCQSAQCEAVPASTPTTVRTRTVGFSL